MDGGEKVLFLDYNRDLPKDWKTIDLKKTLGCDGKEPAVEVCTIVQQMVSHNSCFSLSIKRKRDEPESFVMKIRRTETSWLIQAK